MEETGMFLRSSTGPNRRFQTQSLGRVRDPVSLADGPTAIEAATQRRHFGFRLRLVDKLQPIGGAWQRPRRENGKRRVFALHTAQTRPTPRFRSLPEVGSQGVPLHVANDLAEVVFCFHRETVVTPLREMAVPDLVWLTPFHTTFIVFAPAARAAGNRNCWCRGRRRDCGPARDPW